MRSFLVAPLLLLALAAPAAAQSSTDEIFERLNEVRAANGLPALARDAELDTAAAAHTAEMATLSSLFHVSETSGSPLDRAHAAGVDSDDIAENVAMHDSALDAQASLEGSPSHFANMLGPSFTHVGIGVVRTASGTYLTELFAHLDVATPPVAAAPVAPIAPPSSGVAPPVSSPGSGGVVPPVTAPATSAPAASTGAIVVPPSPTGVVTVPSPAPGVTGYWVCANQRWYYYPVTAGASGGTRLSADMSVTGPPPGHSADECMLGAPGMPRGHAPAPAPPPGPPPSGGGSIIRVEPGRIITPWGTIRTR